MKSLILFLFLVWATCCSAQTAADTTAHTVYYSSPEAAAVGFVKVSVRYRTQDGKRLPVIRDEQGNAFAIFANCERGFYRVSLNPATVAATD